MGERVMQPGCRLGLAASLSRCDGGSAPDGGQGRLGDKACYGDPMQLNSGDDMNAGKMRGGYTFKPVNAQYAIGKTRG